MLTQRLNDLGFDPVVVLDAPEVGAGEGSVVLAFVKYEAEHCPDDAAWIHPYYYASQQGYEAAKALAAELKEEGVYLRDDILLKPIFARLPGLSRGRNTLSVLNGYGSRFHVQTFVTEKRLPATHHLLEAPQPPHCGECRRCMEACPTCAITEEGFCREKCIRHWQLSGKVVPEAIRPHMKGSLVGCDVCQAACPHNPPVEKMGVADISLPLLLTDVKSACETLKPRIGANLAILNRVLAQACLLAGNSGDASLLPLLTPLMAHPSPAVKEHASWAVARLKK